jgi:prepilin-type N-terminal cleavage/methylation domain-containing protein
VRNGFSQIELVVVMAIVALVSAIALPQLNDLFDAVAADAAARDVTTALAVARNAAVLHGTRARLRISPDSLVIEREEGSWVDYARWPGPRSQGVTLTVSNDEVVFGATGMGWGPSNTKVVLQRGSHIETITTSRVGRVKRR